MIKQVDPGQSYQQFHSERHDTFHLETSHDDLEHRGLVRHFHIKYPVQSLLTHFRKIFNDLGYKTTEVFSGKILLVRLGFFDRLKVVFTSKKPEKYLLTVKTQQYKNSRRVTIKKLTTSPISFEESTLQQIRSLFACIDQNPLKAPQLGKDNKDDDFVPSSEYQQDIYSLEATATYMYHKIFVDGNYSMGKKMNKLIQEGRQDMHEQGEVKEAAVVTGGLREITDDMLKSFNCTRKQLLEILCHCRKSVQDYYHDRKFRLLSKQQLEQERGFVDTQMHQQIPQTIKAFHRLISQKNSSKILLGIFMIKYIFKLQCERKQMADSERKILSKKLGNVFGKQLTLKTRALDCWGLSHDLYSEYLSEFMNIN